jgi:inositol phosphorylceramide mannosyltransferase catalytic subunit
MPGQPNFSSFEEGMKFSQAYREGHTSPEWECVRNLYEDFRQGTNQTPRIPKILHQIWLGGELPSQYRSLVKSLRDLHPSWEYRFWGDADITFDFSKRTLFDQCTNPGQKSDILRYAILERFGGIYLDMDFIAVRPLDALRGADFFAGITYDAAPQLANGLIGCTPSHPLMQKISQIDGVPESADMPGVMQSTGPDYFTKMFFNSESLHTGAVAFPNTFFYPFPNFPHDRVRGGKPEAYFGEDTFCCHLWHCSWLKTRKPTLWEKIGSFFHA